MPPQTGQPLEQPPSRNHGTTNSVDTTLFDTYRNSPPVTCEVKPGYVPIPSQFPHESSDYYDCTLYKKDTEVAAQYDAAKKSVVKIEVERDIVVDGQPRTLHSAGSGFVVTVDGKVATNLHVVDHSSRVSVKTADGNSYPAQVIKLSKENDLAVIKMQSPKNTLFTPLMIGDSESLKPGDAVTGFGYPKGWDRMFASPGGYSFVPGGFRYRSKMADVARRSTDGLMPGENPNRVMLSSEIMTNEGNSGGPLMHHNRVVGVMTLSNVDNLTHSTRVEDLTMLLNQIEFDQALKGNAAFIPGSTSLPNSAQGRAEVRSKAAELIYNFQSIKNDAVKKQ